STPGVLIGRGQESLDFRSSQEAHQRASLPFVGDGEHALDLCGVCRLLVSGVAKEGTNGREAQRLTLLRPFSKWSRKAPMSGASRSSTLNWEGSRCRRCWANCSSRRKVSR